MLSLEKKFLFIHPPKTGGTSIKNVLKRYQTATSAGAHHSLFFNELKDKSWKDLSEYYDSEISKGNEKVINMLKMLPSPLKDRDKDVVYNKTLKSHLTSDFHLTYSQWAKIISPEKLSKLTVFGTARNPYDRVISLYMWQNNGKFDLAGIKDKIRQYAFLLFNDYNPCSYYMSALKKPENKRDLSSVSKEVGKKVDPISLVPAANFYIRYETQLNQRTIDDICKKLKIESSQLYHLNRNSKKEKKHYSEYYDDELYDIVTKFYSTDIEMFDYSFEDKR